MAFSLHKLKTGLLAPDSLMETLMPAEDAVRVRGMLGCPLDRPAERSPLHGTSVSPPSSSTLNHSISYSWNNSTLIAISCCKLNNCTLIEFKRLSLVEGAQRNFHSPLQKQNEQKVARQSSNWMFNCGLFLNLQILLMSHSEMINGNASSKSLAGNNAAHWQLTWTDWWPFSLAMCLLMSSFVDQSEFNHWQPSKGDSVLQLIDGRLWDLCWCETFGFLISMYMLYASLHSWFWTTCHYCLILH